MCRIRNPGSATPWLVAPRLLDCPWPAARSRIYYEGNVIGAQNLKRFRDKAVQATGRMLHSYPAGYPTRAREDVDPREVVEIGAIDTKTYRIDISANATDLSWWIDADDLVDLGLIQKGRLAGSPQG